MSDPLGLKLLTYLRLNLSHLSQNKFSHNFRDTLNLCVFAVLVWKQQIITFCIYKIIKTTDHYILHSLHKEWRFPLRISVVNVTKSAEIRNGKLHFLCSGCQNFVLIRSNFLKRIFETNVEFTNINNLNPDIITAFWLKKTKP